MGNVVGIDLGTTNTVVAILDITGKPKIQPNSLGQNMTPSAVWINEKDSSTIIGTEAITKADMGIPIYQNYKRDIGQNIVYKTVNGIEITPERLSTLVLKKCKDDLDNDGGTDEETTNCVITYPANFTNESREATVSAGELAEWPIGQGIDEPTAAGLYFAYTHKVDAGTYAVYDFGGGTWDISVVKIKGQEVNVIDTEGIPKCGGRDFDSRLQSLIEEKYKEETGNDIDYNLNEKSIYENLKKSLTVVDERHVSIKRAAGAPQLITVTRDEFSQAIASLLVGTEMVCEALFEKHPDIKDVFLVGGSTRVPAVKESLENKFGKPGLTIGNPDEIIALGAAIYSGINSKEDLNAAQKQNLDSVEFTASEIDLQYNAAMADLDHGKYSDAVDGFSKVIVTDPNYKNVLYRRADCYHKQDQFENSIEDLNLYIDKLPEINNAYYIRAECYYAIDQWEKAIVDYTKYLSFGNVDIKDCYHMRGDCFRFKQAYYESTQDYSTFIKSQPSENLELVLINRGKNYIELKEFDLAIEDFSSVTELNPKNDIAVSLYYQTVEKMSDEGWISDIDVDEREKSQPDVPIYNWHVAIPETAALEKYKKTKMPDNQYKDIHSSTNQYFENLIYTVVESEGPVHKDVIIDRIKFSFGKKQIRGPLRTRLERCISKVKKSYGFDQIPIINDNLFIYANADQLNRNIRTRPDSDITHYNPTELYKIVLFILRQKETSNQHDLVKLTSSLLGWDVVKSRIRSTTTEIIERLELLGYIERIFETNFLVFTQKSQPVNEIPEHSEKIEPEDKTEDKWYIYYESLKQYKKIYENILVPYSFTTSDGIKLGKWCADKREEYYSGNLNESYIKKLNELGFKWNIN